MGAVAKADMAVGIAVDAEIVGCFEDVLIAIGGKIAEHKPVAFRDVATADFGVLRGAAHEVLDGRGPAYGFFDQTGDEVGI